MKRMFLEKNFLASRTTSIKKEIYGIRQHTGNTQQFSFRGSIASRVVNEELCTHKRNKLKGDVEMGRKVSALIKNEQVSTLIQLTTPKKCKDPGTFPCTIGKCTFVDAMLDLGVSINDTIGGGSPTSEAVIEAANPTILDVIKKEVMKLLAAGIIYPISDSQWVSLVQVGPKKSGMTVVKNHNDELIDIRSHSLARLTHLPTLGCRSTYATPQASSKESCMEVFMDDFTMYNHSFDACLESLSRVLDRCIETYLVLNFEKCHFMELKKRLTTTPILQAHDWELPFKLMCDASKLALGVVLGQQIGKNSHVIAYASRTLDSAQANHTTTEKELLAIIFALDKFCSYLLGSKIVVFSDHVGIMSCTGQLGRMPTISLPPASNAKEQESPLPRGMRCSSSLFFFVRFGVSKALINGQGSHFSTMSTLLEKYRMVHRVAKVFNREIKQILQKVAHTNRKDWSRLLEDTLWAHRTTYRTLFGISPYRIVFGKTCHLLIKKEHHAYWAVKRCNLAFDQVGKERKLQLQELQDLRLEPCENSKVYKDKALAPG
ncbi:Retrovirus-related Pol polyprotein, partial [Mucuna pruriens]